MRAFIHSFTVGVFFRDDAAADAVDGARARGMLAALCDAHEALMMRVGRTLAMNGGSGGRYYREDVVERARTCARATTALVRACCARDGDGRAKRVRAAEEMRACVREAGVPDEDVEPGFAEFVDAAETAKRAAVE